MRLENPFGRLQIEVDVDEIVSEVDRLDPSWWRPHPEGHVGNDALPIVSANGSVDDDAVDGDMLPTAVLQLLPSLVPVLAAFDTPVGRTRMMRIAPGGEATAHVDLNRYWWDRHRVHIPLRTDPRVEFRCGDDGVHMPAGSAWVFDTWRKHNVVNLSSSERIHLVFDTVGSPTLTALLADDRPERRGLVMSATPRFVTTRRWKTSARWRRWSRISTTRSLSRSCVRPPEHWSTDGPLTHHRPRWRRSRPKPPLSAALDCEMALNSDGPFVISSSTRRGETSRDGKWVCNESPTPFDRRRR